ncbi:hypothetical protein DMH25_09570 [Streptomyces sp. WAC 01325]|nr:hypothetical protein DMH25_09570 [Streptomyces sp. WAC 01325]
MQRLTTAPPWRHAPRFFLSEGVVANPRAERGVLGQNHTPASTDSAGSHGGTPECRSAVSVPGPRTRPPGRR